MLFVEFMEQGDVEKKLGLEVAPFMDRECCSPPQTQQGFIKFIVMPLYEAWTLFLPACADTLMPRLESNLVSLKEWEVEETEEKKQRAALLEAKD